MDQRTRAVLEAFLQQVANSVIEQLESAPRGQVYSTGIHQLNVIMDQLFQAAYDKRADEAVALSAMVAQVLVIFNNALDQRRKMGNEAFEETYGENAELLAMMGKHYDFLDEILEDLKKASQGKPICIGCTKRPDEIAEYITEARMHGIKPDEYVINNEGTYNRDNGHFYCTHCYITNGTPVGVAP